MWLVGVSVVDLLTVLNHVACRDSSRAATNGPRFRGGILGEIRVQAL